MKINMKKSKEEVEISINTQGKISKFDYINFIDLLYNGEEIEEVCCDKSIIKNEEDQINNMIKEINIAVETNIKK